MFSHICVGVTDFDRALAFYRPLMDVLGLPERFCEPEHPWAAWESVPEPRPLFIIGHPVDGQPQHAGNGHMTAFQAATRAIVDAAHACALAHGGTDEGAPGPRPHYHAHYYGTYFRDPDGNKLCVVCHHPEAEQADPV